jgi:SAM-dependent methyltransferase
MPKLIPMADLPLPTPAQASITRQVRDQYERFPYPSKDCDLQPFITGQRAEVGFPRQYYHLLWPHQGKRDDLDILVAGCGTSQAARYAAAHPHARITGIDLSATSLAHCQSLCQQYQINNISLQQMSLLDLPELNRQFDYIVCTGVIHHMASPGAGLDALRQVLRPGGSMYLMVYARYGRDAIYLLQRLLRELDLRAKQLDDNDIAVLLELLDRLPPTHPLHFRRDQFHDIGKTAELIDYLLHVQDQPFTIKPFYELLQQHEFSVQHLINRAHYLHDALPVSLRQTVLDSFDEARQLAIGELLRAGIDKHEVFCVRSDRAVEDWRISLTDANADDHIPVRSPALHTELVREDQGTVLRAVSGSHQFADLQFSLSPVQAQVLNCINGQRSLHAIHTYLQQQQRTISRERLHAVCQWLIERDLIFLRGAQSGTG